MFIPFVHCQGNRLDSHRPFSQDTLCVTCPFYRPSLYQSIFPHKIKDDPLRCVHRQTGEYTLPHRRSHLAIISTGILSSYLSYLTLHQNEPIFIHSNAEAVDALHFHFICHSALDLLEERKGKRTTTAAADQFLGQLSPMEDYRM